MCLWNSDTSRGNKFMEYTRYSKNTYMPTKAKRDRRTNRLRDSYMVVGLTGASKNLSYILLRFNSKGMWCVSIKPQHEFKSKFITI